MMSRSWLLVLGIGLCCGLMMMGGSPAQSKDAGWMCWNSPCGNIAEWFDYGGDFRVRHERFPGVLALDPDMRAPISEWMRFRSRVWYTMQPTDSFKLQMRIVNESRPILSPGIYRSPNPYDRYDKFDEILIDNLYLEQKCRFGILRIGRQDMIAIPGTTGPMGTGFGEGFIFMDGTPGDGSRTFYFDALRLTLDLSGGAETASLDLMAIANFRYSQDSWLPPIGANAYRRLDDWDNTSFAAYYKNAGLMPGHQLDLYYLYKSEDRQFIEEWERADPYKVPGSHLNVFGGRMSGKINDRLSYAVEGAFQFGAWNEGDGRRGFATEESIKYDFKGCMPFSPTVKLYHVYLSGDDPDTSRNESWRPMYGRWPKWGELMGYIGGSEEGVYYPTNLHILGLETTWKICDPIQLSLMPGFLFADENPFAEPSVYASPAKAAKFGTGSYRGFYPRASLTWKLNDMASLGFLYEYLDTGSYYDGVAKSDYYFAQTQLTVTF